MEWKSREVKEIKEKRLKVKGRRRDKAVRESVEVRKENKF